MTTADLTERLKRYPIPTVCAVVLLACFLAYYFRMDLLTQLETRWEEISRQANQVEDNLVAGTTLGEHLDTMQARLAAFDQRVVRQPELATNLKYFYELESATGVSLSDLRQGTVPPPGKDAARPLFVGVPYNVLLGGSFAQVVAYFNELENGPRFYRLRSFDLQRGREVNQTNVAVALNLELLGWP